MYFLGTCFLYSRSVFSMNFLSTPKSTPFSFGVAKVRFIFKSPNFFAKIFQFAPSAPVFRRTLCLYRHPFLKRECKGTTIFRTSKFFWIRNRLKYEQKSPYITVKYWFIHMSDRCYNFVKIMQTIILVTNRKNKCSKQGISTSIDT